MLLLRVDILVADYLVLSAFSLLECAIHMVQKDIGLIQNAEGQVHSAHMPPPYKRHAFSGDVNLSIVKVLLAGLYLHAGPK